MSTYPKPETVREFLDAFEEVFDRDWTYTKEMLGVGEQTEEQKRACAEAGLETIPIIDHQAGSLRGCRFDPTATHSFRHSRQEEPSGDSNVFPGEPLNEKDTLFTMLGKYAPAATGTIRPSGSDMEPDAMLVQWVCPGKFDRIQFIGRSHCGNPLCGGYASNMSWIA